MALPAVSSPTTGRRQAIALAVVLLSALLLRAGLFAAVWHNTPDLHTLNLGGTDSYRAPAESLLADRAFSDGNIPEIFRTPGYPLLLTVGLLSGHFELVTVALQIMLSVASVALVYHLAWKLTANSTAALVASALAALEPVSIAFTSYLMSETLFAFLLLASLALLLRYLRTSSVLALVAAGLLLAATALVRPVGYYLPLALVPLLVVRAFTGRSRTGQASGHRAGRLRETVLALVLAVVCFAPLAAWQVRNYLLTGYSGFAAVADFNLYFYQGLSIVARQSGKSLEQVQTEMGRYDSRVFDALHPELRDAGQAAKFHYLHAEGSRLVRENPITYAKIHARGMAVLALDPGTALLLRVLGRFPEASPGLKSFQNGIGENLLRMHREFPQLFYLSIAMGAALALIYCASALGLLVACRRLTWQWTLVLVTLAYFPAISGGPTGDARLRHPAMPVICILAGCGVATLLSHLTRKQQSKPGRSVPIAAEPPLVHAA